MKRIGNWTGTGSERNGERYKNERSTVIASECRKPKSEVDLAYKGKDFACIADDKIKKN